MSGVLAPEETRQTHTKNTMAFRLAPFEMPNRLAKNEDTATSTYAQFVAEPFDRGYGHTVGNSLRRVLLSGLEGAAITSVKIAGAPHEFTSLPGIVEDVTQIVLNLKKVRFSHDEEKEPQALLLSANKEGVVTAGDITENAHFKVINEDQVICTIDRKTKFECEMEVRVGRGFRHRGGEQGEWIRQLVSSQSIRSSRLSSESSMLCRIPGLVTARTTTSFCWISGQMAASSLMML